MRIVANTRLETSIDGIGGKGCLLWSNLPLLEELRCTRLKDGDVFNKKRIYSILGGLIPPEELVEGERFI